MRAALLSAHGLKSVAPHKIAPGDRLQLVADIDLRTGTVEVLDGVVLDVSSRGAAFESQGQRIDDVALSSFATWDVPVLADGVETRVLPASASSTAGNRGRRNARYAS